ncbi:hypothetical protein T01_2816, partial [Trichinella spiralis]
LLEIFVMADIPELPFVTNRRSGTSLVYEGRAYKLRYTSKRVKNWGMHGHLLGSPLHAHRGRVWSAVVATIRERMMATRRRERGSEDESVKSNSDGRTGGDLEADRAAAPGGSLQ